MNFAKKQVHNPEQGLVNLVNKTFDMYECSTFHGFRTERQICIKFESSLQRVLSKHLNIREITTDDKQLPSRSKIQRRIASNMRGDLQRVDVRPFPIEGWDSPYTPMEINIHIRYDETDKDEISNIIMIPSKEQPENESFSAYPLLLVRSKQVVWEVVAHWIKRTLDCHVFQLTVPVALLGQIAEWWASYLYDMPPGENERVNGFQMRAPKTTLGLEFSVTEIQDISTFTISLEVEDVMRMFRIVKASNMTLLDTITEHIANTMSIQVSSFALTQLHTPIAYIDINKKKLKMFPGSPKVQLIRLLEDLCGAASNKS